MTRRCTCDLLNNRRLFEDPWFKFSLGSVLHLSMYFMCVKLPPAPALLISVFELRHLIVGWFLMLCSSSSCILLFYLIFFFGSCRLVVFVCFVLFFIFCFWIDYCCCCRCYDRLQTRKVNVRVGSCFLVRLGGACIRG